MKKTHYIVIAIAVCVSAGLVTVMFFFGDDERQGISPLLAPIGDKTRTTAPVRENIEDAIVVRHRIVNGTHIYTGTLMTPTPCHRVSADVREEDASPSRVVLSLAVNAGTHGMICAQVITMQPFAVHIRAPVDATVRGELNGTAVKLVVEEGNGELEVPESGIELVY